MFASDVGGEQAGPDREPTHISAREKEVRAHVFLFARGPVGDPRQDEEISRDNEDIDDVEVAHGIQSVRENWQSSLPYAPRPLKAETAKNLELFFLRRHAERQISPRRLLDSL